jgi:hypothetical protein
MNQPRVPAGVPSGGQFALTHRPEASGVELVDDEGDPVRQALSDIERLGAETADCYAEMGRAAAALPSTARAVVGEALGTSSRHDDRDALVPRLAEIALRRAAGRAGIAGERLDDVLRGIPKFMVGSIRTDLERSARYHVRQALSLEDDGDTSWVCPIDPGHATRDGICAACGVRSIANHPDTEQVPTFNEPEGETTWTRRSEAGVQSRAGDAGSVPSKPERVLRELVSELYRLQNEADEGNDDDMSQAFDRAAEMLEATITDAFSDERFGLGAGQSPTPDIDEISIDPASVDWTACGDSDEPGGEDAQLLGTVWIGRTPFHALALQVDDRDDGIQTALQRDEDLGMAMNALGDQEPYGTVEIGGRPYVLLLSPHAR